MLIYSCRTVKKKDMVLNNYLPKLTGEIKRKMAYQASAQG